MKLQGRVALVTGAGSGLGKATALRLAREGAKVAALSRTADEIQHTVKEIRANGGEGLVVKADISDAQAMQQAYQQIVDEWGRLDVVFANAGINGTWTSIEDLSVEDWEKTISINLTGTFLTVKYAVPHLKQHGGAIVITSSVNGTRMFSNTGASAYASTKAAQVAFTKMMALELAKHRIRVNVICPGAIESKIDDNTSREDLEAIREPVEYPEGQIPLTDGKPGEAEDVADLVFFLVSDASKHITGTEVWIDGGQSLLQG